MVGSALLLFQFGTVPLPAQTNAPRELTSRYLFIVDTSAAMSRTAPGAQTAIGNLLRSGLSGQLRSGDTVGVWTFAEQLNAGRFPLPHWSPERTEAVASNVVAFLRSQRHPKKSRCEIVAPARERIIRDSCKLTALLVTDGDEKISGTPYDHEIQAALGQHFKAQQRARQPFVIVLRTSRGQFINATVNLAPWTVEFPAFPPEPKVVEAPKPKPPQKKPAPRPAARPNAAGTTNPARSQLMGINATGKVESASTSSTPVSTPSNPSETTPAPAQIPSPALNDAATRPITPATTVLNSAASPPEPAAALASIEIAKPPLTLGVQTKPPPPAVSTQAVEPTPLSAPIPPVEPAPVPQSTTALSRPAKNLPTNDRAIANPPEPGALAVQPPEPGRHRARAGAAGRRILFRPATPRSQCFPCQSHHPLIGC